MMHEMLPTPTPVDRHTPVKTLASRNFHRSSDNEDNAHKASTDFGAPKLGIGGRR